MNAITKPRERESAQRTSPPLIHRYRGQSLAHPTGIGAVALCGHVRRTPWSVGPNDKTTHKLNCVVCRDLAGFS